MFDPKSVKLGRKPAIVSDKTLMFAKYLKTGELPPIPKDHSYSWFFKNWGMMLNDKIGDCTCAAAGHQIVNWTNMNGELFIPSDADILVAYRAVSGYDPVTGANDNGAACLDVLNYLQKVGIAGRKIGPFMALNVKNLVQMKIAIYLFGSIYLGINMPLTAQNQTEMWDVVDPSLTGDSTPASWGGHCVILTAYGQDVTFAITWGEKMKMTNRFWDAYVEEAYVILDPEWFASNGNRKTNPIVAPSGFDMAQLQADLALL